MNSMAGMGALLETLLDLEEVFWPGYGLPSDILPISLDMAKARMLADKSHHSAVKASRRPMEQE